MRFVPTVTRIWPQLDLAGVEEVLLTPISLELPQVPSILVDNGLFATNRRQASHRLDSHIELCAELAKDPRCIFILPDLERDLSDCKRYIQLFLEIVQPKRYAAVDIPALTDWYGSIWGGSEFYCIPSCRATQAREPIELYHQLGKRPRPGGRSWDDLDYDATESLLEVISFKTQRGY